MRNHNDGARPAARVTPIHALLAAVILGLVAMPLAFAGAASGPEATASAVSNAKFKKLKQRVTALETKLNGQATGDLSGSYPNLQIRPAAVNTNELADNAVNTAKLANDAVNAAKIQNGQVRAADVGPIVPETDPGTDDIGGIIESASCATGRMLSGGGFFSGTVGADVWLNQSYPISDSAWGASGNNATGANRTLTPHVLCLQP